MMGCILTGFFASKEVNEFGNDGVFFGGGKLLGFQGKFFSFFFFLLSLSSFFFFFLIFFFFSFSFSRSIYSFLLQLLQSW